MNFKKAVHQTAGYVHKAAEWYGTAKTIYHAARCSLAFAAEVAPLIL